ncbi:MAG: NAD-dependent epimerase/dehydratase family protein [Chloroflexota bacterium]|nr:NAD-dependent epimerase/dehydratase family protein [Chloroflexota bacterium]
MKYFITGGAGFIGSHLVDRLTNTGLVTVYDNLSSGKREFISQHLNNPNFKFIQADVLDRGQLSTAIKGSDVVFHMSANPDVRLGQHDTAADLNQGTIATYDVLETMRRQGIGKIIFASSSVVYGEISGEPASEDHGPLQPISLYGAAKLASEGLITAFCHLFNMQAWIFRFANVVGPRATHGVIYDFINKLKKNNEELEILGDGKQSKPYIHVSDCVDGVLYGHQHSDGQVNVFNLGNHDMVDVTTISRILLEQMGLSEVTLRYTGGSRGWPGDVPRICLETSRMEKLGWKPKYSSEEAIRLAIKEILAESA